ncbi:AAA family ATPase [Arthrobacter glacialis]|uniref:Nuclease SbcCD subunit C n=1 Tax=Arthrobacter glacialis TaxID=1664 RepID=A0A2S3ZZM2_ARTGL|nr:SMC family ATPase [Arthrobacter glacialis]POH74459.1 SMC family ATPase [Arthrobacter glacialis]
MRIHRLEIQAFGPFAGREVVDFDELGAQGIFLLNGSTGAGKTSVLDAIAYALYGQVPGARQGTSGQLRSHHAGEGVGPEVLCEFSAGGRRLEVQRKPEWMRPVKRGQGTTREQASTQLREQTADGWEVKSTRNDEAAAEIQGLLGMTMAQFTKVVLLAQGDFAAFLRATAEERQTLLQKLFGTDIYKDLEVRLTAESRQANTDVAAGLNELAATQQLARSQSAPTLAADVAAQAQASPPEQDTDAVDIAELAGLELFAELGRQVALAVAAAQGRAAQAEQQHDHLEEAVRDAQARSARHTALASALAEQLRLAGLAEQSRLWRDQQEQHHEAQVLAAVVDAAVTTSQAGQQARAMVASAAASFSTNEVAVALLGQPVDTAGASALETVDRELTTQLAAVAAVLPDEVRLGEKTTLLASNRSSLSLVLTLQQEQGEAVGAARTRLDQIQGQLTALREGAQSVELTQQAAQQAESLVHTIIEHTAQQLLVTHLAEAESSARGQALDAKETWLQAFDRRLSQVAGELAADLVDGDPCQVCGSTVHPDPSPLASSGADLPKAEKAAKQAHELAEKMANTARTELAQGQSTLAVLVERGGTGKLNDAQDAVVQATMAHERASKTVSEIAALAAEAATQEEHLAAARSAGLAAAERAAALSATNAALGQEIELLNEQLTLARDGYPSLALRQAALTQAQVPADALLRAVRERGTAMQAQEAAAIALTQALAASDFSDVAQVKEALLSPSEAAAVDKDLKDYTRAVAVNADRLAAADAVLAAQEAAANVPVPTVAELEALRSAAKDAQTHARAGAVALGLAESAAGQLAATEISFRKLEATVAPLRERAALLAGLADVVRGSGDNRYKMTLTSYVLAARLEQVAQAASLRLSTMSDARYTLRHSDAKTGGNRKSGLGLEVVDQWTGVSRDTATLSGGESFMASLSLALGLSDVVQQESGGLDMETLFVDEGFGSLDEQSLEQVMDALEGLRDGGRMIGLVSHVAEMKTRIPMHLHVLKGRSGSTLTVGSLE